MKKLYVIHLQKILPSGRSNVSVREFFLILLLTILLSGFRGLLAQIPNAQFSSWNKNEPNDWLTNNWYDNEGQFIDAYVLPVANGGVKLVVKKTVIELPDSTHLTNYVGGKLTSYLIPQLVEASKPITLMVAYNWQPQEGDVLKAHIEISPRDIDPEGNPLSICTCEIKNREIILPSNNQQATWQVTFPKATNAGVVPEPCKMYVWKLRFWLENTQTHLHEGSEATIKSIVIP